MGWQVGWQGWQQCHGGKVVRWPMSRVRSLGLNNNSVQLCILTGDWRTGHSNGANSASVTDMPNMTDLLEPSRAL
jgi:hypothetical protein